MTKTLVKEIQRHLKRHGFDPGPIDGYSGPRTSAAIIAFKRSVNLRPRDFIGPITLGELRKDAKDLGNGYVTPAKKSKEPVWLRRARQEIGVREIVGSRHSRRVLSYWELAKLSFTDDETPWCAGYVAAMLEDCDIRSPRSGMARSFQRWGKELSKPIPGCIVVFWRGSKGGSSGHVGFVTGRDQASNLMVLGGNQGNAVNIKPFLTSRVLSYRWPSTYDTKGAELSTVNSDGIVSNNEQ
jgi:uncharacterized protein (TIGR02594 family)